MSSPHPDRELPVHASLPPWRERLWVGFVFALLVQALALLLVLPWLVPPAWYGVVVAGAGVAVFSAYHPHWRERRFRAPLLRYAGALVLPGVVVHVVVHRWRG